MPKNPDYAIDLRDLTLAGAIRVNTRTKLTQDRLKALHNIPGVWRVDISEAGYSTSIDVGQYSTRIDLTRLFNFKELAPQILLVFADALGVDVEYMTVTTSTALATPLDSEWVVEAARALRPKPAPAPRNPHAPDFAATMDDVVYGAKLLWVRIYGGTNVEVEGFTIYEDCGIIRYRTSYGASDDITAFGLTRGFSAHWVEDFSVVNTPENRRLLLQWLLEKKLDKAAEELLKLYPELVQTTVLVKNGQVFAGVTLT